MSQNLSWSDWLDFSQEKISIAPSLPGVFMMHASMKILYIGGSKNIRETLEEHFNHSCISDATRFRFMQTNDYEKTKLDLIRDYKERHEGKLPRCMEEVH